MTLTSVHQASLPMNCSARIANQSLFVEKQLSSNTMKRLIFLIYVLSIIMMSFGDDIAERLAEELSMSRTDVQICINKTSVKVEDFSRMDELIDDNVQTISLEKSALRVGCFMTCLGQKKGMMSGVHINVDKIVEFTDSKMNGNAMLIMIRNRILDICIERVKSKIDECEVSLKFVLCVIGETQRYHRRI